MYHILKGEREYDEKKYEAALKKRSRIITNFTTIPDMGKTEESDAWYQQWAEAEPDNGTCINGYAFCHQIRRDIAGAIKLVESYLPEREIADIKYENLYIRAADLYNQNGENKKAEHFRKLLEEIFK